MSDEENKNWKKKFIKWLVSSLCLTGGAVGGISAVAETEEKTEESEGEENNQPTGSGKKAPITKPVDSKIDLSALLSTWNPTIATNGQTFTHEQNIEQLKQQLPTGIIKEQVNITINGTTATIQPTSDSKTYKGAPFTKTFTLDTKQALSSLLSTWNPTIATNGQTFTHEQNIEQLKQQLPTGIIKEQVNITINGTTATIQPTSDSKTYKGAPFTKTFTLDTKQALSSLLSTWNPTIATNGQTFTHEQNIEQLKQQLPTGIIKEQVNITINGTTATIQPTSDSKTYKGAPFTKTFTLDTKQALSSLLSTWNPTIATNGQTFTHEQNIEQLKQQLPTGIIKEQVNITINGTTATIQPTSDSKTYKGAPFTKTFTLDTKQALSSLLSTWNPTIATNGQTFTHEQNIEQLKQQLPTGIIKEQVNITINGTTATIQPTSDSKTYKGAPFTKTFTLDTKQALSSLLSTWNPTIATNGQTFTHEQNIEQLKQQLPTGIIKEQVNITINGTTATIQPTSDSKTYKGAPFTKTFTLDTKQALSSLLSTWNPTIATNGQTFTHEQNIEQLKQQLPTGIIKEQVNITINGTTATIQPTSDSKTYKGAPFTKTFTLDTKQALSSLLSTWNPTIATNGQTFTHEQNIEQLKQQLPTGIIKEQVNITINGTTATIQPTSDSKTYKGAPFTKTFTLDTKQALSSLLSTWNPTIATNGQTFTHEQNIEQLKQQLPTGIIKEQVNITINGTTATIQPTSDSKTYKGVPFTKTFTLDTKQALSSLLSTWNPTIATNGANLTPAMIKAKLPANIQNEVDINIQGNKATLTAKATSTDYQGTVEVTFTVNNRVIQQDTIYIDKHGQQRTTNERNLSNIETTEIIQIGFYKNEKGEIQVVQMPITIEKVPDQLPSEITSINKMFWKCKWFNQDISNWDTSNVTDMGGAFQETKFNQDISNWDTSNVTDMSEMFRNNKSFKKNIGKWNTSKVTNMSHMFQDAVVFNQDISNWDTSNVTDMSYMFGYHRYFDQDLSKWNVSKVIKYEYFADWSKIANTNKLPNFGA